jgi:hypothetical protein
MSWWETGSERLKIGDVPADKIGSGLKHIVAEKKKEGAAAPTLPQLISALEQALRSRGGGRIVANTSAGAVSAGGRNDPVVDREVARIVTAVADSYQTELDREATPAEILACFDFVLGPAPARYLSEVTGQEINDIRFAAPSPAGTSGGESSP